MTYEYYQGYDKEPEKNLDQFFDVKNVSWTIEAYKEVTVIRPMRGVVKELEKVELQFTSGVVERDFRKNNRDLIFVK